MGVAHAVFSEHLQEETAETVVELFYKAPISPWATLQPDLQYLVNPGGAGAMLSWPA